MTTSPRSTEPDSSGEGVGERTSGERVVPMRLQRFLARAGVASRRGSERLMTAGRVCVNGVVARELGIRVDPACDVVKVDGQLVTLTDGPVYLALHKPAGVLTTMSDTHGRRTVAELVPREPAGIFPVGRLDLDTTGLLLFTTDGDLAYRLLHPRYHVEKTYHAVVDGVPAPEDLERLSAGIELDDGMTAPARVRMLEQGAESHVEIAIREGRKRQVRRMFQAIGHPVIALHRVSFGPVDLGDLAPGAHRLLSTDELRALLEHASEREG